MNSDFGSEDEEKHKKLVKAADILYRFSKSKRIYLEKISKHELRECLQRNIDYDFQYDDGDKFLKKAMSIA